MIRLASKLVFSGGTLGGTLLLNTPVSNSYKNIEQKTNSEQPVETFKTLEDVRIFERMNGCYFAFVKSWGTKELYKLDEFMKKETSKNWENEIIKGANIKDSQNKCKKDKVVALFYATAHGFNAGKPNGGW